MARAIIKRREKAVDFLQTVLDFVEKKNKTRGFNFNDFVTKFDEKNWCGKVCCMEGWLPAIFPEKVRWFKEEPLSNLVVRTIRENYEFYPQKIKIPISIKLWDALTVPDDWGCEELLDSFLPVYSKFREVKRVWNKAILMIKKGELDAEVYY